MEKVLQQGDISDAAEPYYRGSELEREKKAYDKVRTNAKMYCKQLGQYRMPFAWAAINVIDLIAGNQSSMGTSAICTQDSPRDRSDSTSSNRRNSGSNVNTQDRSKTIATDVPRRKEGGRTGTVSTQVSKTGLDDGVSEDECIIPQNFSPVTLSLNMFLKQVHIHVHVLVVIYMYTVYYNV